EAPGPGSGSESRTSVEPQHRERAPTRRLGDEAYDRWPRTSLLILATLGRPSRAAGPIAIHEQTAKYISKAEGWGNVFSKFQSDGSARPLANQDACPHDRKHSG